MKQLMILLVIFTFISTSFYNCGGDSNEEWASGDSARANELNLNVDDVQKAFKEAKGPEDFEKRVNQIYTGDEIISIYVAKAEQGKQLVTLYIDKDPKDGQVQDKEKILDLSRIVDDNKKEARLYTHGYGPYGYYTGYSPLTYMATGALMYWALSRPYYTPVSRYSTIRTNRSAYRSTPAYQNQVSKTKSFSNNFNKSAPKSFKSANSPASKVRAGSWGGGSKSATGGSKSFGGSKSSGGTRSFGGSGSFSSGK